MLDESEKELVSIYVGSHIDIGMVSHILSFANELDVPVELHIRRN